ncbi:hypothetical protein CF328_g7637 [Tilletia controversa]|nr:hypothetical protein CF328_g7637 [Tilletia controversa]
MPLRQGSLGRLFYTVAQALRFQFTVLKNWTPAAIILVDHDPAALAPCINDLTRHSWNTSRLESARIVSVLAGIADFPSALRAVKETVAGFGRLDFVFTFPPGQQPPGASQGPVLPRTTLFPILNGLHTTGRRRHQPQEHHGYGPSRRRLTIGTTSTVSYKARPTCYTLLFRPWSVLRVSLVGRRPASHQHLPEDTSSWSTFHDPARPTWLS